MSDKKLWFKRKIYGWGWYPCTWEGWFVTGFFIAFLIVIAGTLPKNGKITEYFIALILSVLALIFICYKKGEKPRWSWGS